MTVWQAICASVCLVFGLLCSALIPNSETWASFVAAGIVIIAMDAK